MFEAQTISELAAKAGKKKVARAEQGLITGQVPLTPIQNHFFEQHYSNPNHWNQAILVNIRLPGVHEAKDRERTLRPIIESALRQVTRHHDMLRARYYQEEKGWVQIIEGDQIDLPPVDWVDLSTLDPADRLSEMEGIASSFQGRLDITNGPIMRIVVFDFGRDLPSRMLFIIHHLVIDGISWRILMEDFQTAFEQIQSSNKVVLPLKTTSYMEWADQLYEFSNSRELKDDFDYWMEIHLSDNKPFSTDIDIGPNIESSVESVRHIIPREETQSILQAVPRVYNTEINEVLLTAIAMAFSPLMRDQALWIQMEGHGREDLSPRETEDKPGYWIDISRTIGWFTTMYPVRLQVNRAHGIGETLIQIKEQVRQIPRRGFTYGILKYVSSDPDLCLPDAKNLITPSVSFNYLGQVEEAGKLSQSESIPAVSDKLIIGISDDSVGYVHDPDNQREFLIDVVASVIEGELRIEWMFSRNYHYRSTIESLADNFHSALNKIIEHCLSPDAGGYSPSDFKDVDIDQDELDALLDEITD
jgi:non-ribosomal peptide synthase protein (TIGR01720 family)